MYVLAVILAVAGSVVYHLSIKFVPSGVNPFLSLSLSYGIVNSDNKCNAHGA